MSVKLEFFATCPKGIADILVTELASFGAEKVKESAAGVTFSGPLEVAYRACLWSRVASRVLMPLAEFPVASEKDLYQGVREVPLEEHFSPGSTFAVSTSGTTGSIGHTHFASLKTKDAVVDRFRDLFGVRPSVNVRNPDVFLNLYLRRDRGTLSLDMSGESLHRRGYRRDRAKAPLKENLAAAILIRAGWVGMALEKCPFIDPMCGSGTLPIEAALIAADMAPGILRSSYGFMGWKKHESGIWTKLQVEARYRMKEGIEGLPVVLGYDSGRESVRAAHENLQRAGLHKYVHIERRSFETLKQPAAVRNRPGLIAANPPYGERIGEKDDLKNLYSRLGGLLKREFGGWKAAVFTGNPELGKAMGLRAFKTNNLYNGKIKSLLLHFIISEEYFKREVSQPTAGMSMDAKAEAESGMFANRLRKNLSNLGKWASAEGISCYRLYDADIPEFNLAVDLYGDQVHVQEYEAPHGVDPEIAAARLKAALLRVGELLQTPEEHIHLKIRRRQRGRSQYERHAKTENFLKVREGGLSFYVNLTDYLDTGLFLDHRITRRMISELSSGKDFLNLFSYTGSATVYAAHGGAASTTSVDMSKVYLDWARRNMEINNLAKARNSYIHSEVLKWISMEKEKYGLIFLDPPTYSRSRGMVGDFDVQRDHVHLIRSTVRLLAPGGILVFSANRRKFVLDTGALEDLQIEDITSLTIPRDFERRPDIHKCFKIKTQHAARSRSARNGERRT